jgi:hypothetical protein
MYILIGQEEKVSGYEHDNRSPFYRRQSPQWSRKFLPSMNRKAQNYAQPVDDSQKYHTCFYNIFIHLSFFFLFFFRARPLMPRMHRSLRLIVQP